MNKLRFLHPFIFALYPALFLYSYNINRFREGVLLTPLLISLIYAGLIFLVCSLIFRKLETSTIISSLLILMFFSYGRLKELFKNLQFNLGSVFNSERSDLFVGSDKIVLAGMVLALGIVIFLILHLKHYLRSINKALGIFSLILIAMVIYNTAFLEVKMGRISLAGLVNDISQLESSISSQTPDIYYFVLDRYAGDKTLIDYGINNSAFINFLKDNGFYIAYGATSNYPKTFLSLGSTLNMEYLDFLTQKTKGGATSDESIVTPLVQNNKVIRFLKSKGYAYIHVGSGWDPTRSNPYADQNFVMNGGRYPFADEFTSGFLQTTMAAPILKKIYPDTTAVSQDPKNNDARSRVLYAFDVFDRIPQINGPKFVFTHILIPHEPYVLGKDCEPLAERVVRLRTGIENYSNQLQCTNKKMKTTIGRILAKSETRPIIIIQADEGPLPIKNPISKNLSWKDAGNDSLREKFPILGAYLLPDLKENPMYPSITPVNSFRIIFNSYFNTGLPLLPDKNIVFEDDQNYYKFIDVTERLKDIPEN